MNYQVLDHDYLNTGGGCMVSTFEVYLKDENKTVFINVNEEGLSMASVNHIGRGIDYENEMSLNDCGIDDLTEMHQYFLLYKECLLEYTKRDCATYHTKTWLPLRLLSVDLVKQMTPGYIAWSEENVGMYETDGIILYKDSSYEPPILKKVVSDPQVLKAKMIIKSMDAAMSIWQENSSPIDEADFYDKTTVVGFGDKLAVFNNGAAVYTAIYDAMKYIIDQY